LNRVVLVGSRAEFERVLNDSVLTSAEPIHGSVPNCPLAESFAWGSFDENGHPFVLAPDGSAGSPLVGVARDLSQLDLACLRPQVQAGSQIVLTDRLDQVLENLDLANRIGERQRLVLFADASRRTEVMTLRKHGWKVWEPRPWEIVPNAFAAEEPARTRVTGIDTTLRSAAAERHPSVGYMPSTSQWLTKAYKLMSDIGSRLGHESATGDEMLQEIMDSVRGVFFGAVSWLSIPEGEKTEDWEATLKQLREGRGYISRCLGNSAALLMSEFLEAIERFIESCVGTKVTPKGAELLRLARNAVQYPSLRQVFVAGSRRSQEEADSLLAANGIALRCKLPNELRDGERALHVVTFSILRRDMFEKLVDPWPTKSIIMAGYDFEIDIYKQRLRWRENLKRRLEVTPDVRAALTAMPMDSFGTPEQPSYFGGLNETVDPPDPIESVAPKTVVRRPINIPEPIGNERYEEVHIVRFIGRSWMPMAQDYHPVCLIPGGADRRSSIQYIEPDDLRPGTRIVVREGGEKDVIKAIAQQICGDARYDRLWQKASLWREALNSGGNDPVRVAQMLRASGIQRHIYTLRSWVTDPNRIGPRSDADVLAIAQAFKLPGKSDADWKACCDAIRELRGIHLAAGARLTDHLFARCGRILLEPAENETAVEFELGVVWILEVAEVESAMRRCPATMTNRLQWWTSDWHDRVFGERIKVKLAP